MAEGENDIDKRSDQEAIKAKLQKLICEYDKFTEGFIFIQKQFNALKSNEIHDAFKKEITWFSAISVGTLLWILGNFDKFRLTDGSMPYKIIYIVSIAFVGFSSLYLAAIQAMFFWYLYEIAKAYSSVNDNIEKILLQTGNAKRNWEHILKKLDQPLDSKSTNELLNNPSMEIIPEFLDIGKKAQESFGSVLKAIKVISEFITSQKGIIVPIFSYIVGVILISIYIILFMYYCV